MKHFSLFFSILFISGIIHQAPITARHNREGIQGMQCRGTPPSPLAIGTPQAERVGCCPRFRGDFQGNGLFSFMSLKKSYSDEIVILILHKYCCY